jgi:hypothetical protein
MTDYFDIFHFVSYLALALIFLALYYQFSKFSRIRAIEKIGFIISTASNEVLKSKLRNLAPIHMSNPELPYGIVASYKGLLVFWCATYMNKRGDVTCWCFRKCESNKDEPQEYWYQAIHVGGLSEEEGNYLVRESNRKIEGLTDITINENGILMIYSRPLFSFSSTLFVLSLAKNYLDKPKSVNYSK